MSQFLTMKEAARKTGKSSSSIRRIIYPILADDHHADRPHVQPSPDEARELRLKGENFAWRISEELLRREVPAESGVGKVSERPAGRSLQDSEAELLDMLRRELDIKNQQITQQAEMLSKQMELINGLTERLGEGNVLIGSLQRQLALGDGLTRTKSTVIETVPNRPGAEESPARAAAKKSETEKPSPKSSPKVAAKPAKPKRGFFAWLSR